ncbi:uncharacterized protein LOC134220328 [Armigeres subalbatus]|uniref:uncharacterized protein LOC134220328 n=1 Tax=Armigeres subalbatus TaxID=124917 RepID=UPI002ED337BE
MVTSKIILLGLVFCLTLSQSFQARGGNQALRKQFQLLALQKYASDRGIEPPSQNDTNPLATIKQRLQQKALSDYAQKLGLSTSTTATTATTESTSTAATTTSATTATTASTTAAATTTTSTTASTTTTTSTTAATNTSTAATNSTAEGK